MAKVKRINWNRENCELLIREVKKRQVDGQELTKEQIREIEIIFGVDEDSKAITNALRRLKNARTGNGCLSDANNHCMIDNLRVILSEWMSEPLPPMTYTRTDGSTGKRNGGEARKYNAKNNYNFSDLNLDLMPPEAPTDTELKQQAIEDCMVSSVKCELDQAVMTEYMVREASKEPSLLDRAINKFSKFVNIIVSFFGR